MIGTGGSFICVSPLLASEVVFVKMPLRLRKRKAKLLEKYLLNRDCYELESSRVRYDADAEQRRASARDMYRANLESNRASKRWQREKTEFWALVQFPPPPPTSIIDVYM